jgi:uncharacterized phiE125 gp8 family phage protein
MAEPVTLAEARRHLDVMRDDQDEMILSMITAAREWVENYTGLSINGDAVTQTFRCFRAGIALLVWPAQDDAEVTVAYLNKAGEPVEVTGARLWRAAKPARLLPPLNGAWPTDADGTIAVTVTGVPFSLKAAMLLMIGDLYNQREETAVGVSISASGAVENLCHPYRMPVIG